MCKKSSHSCAKGLLFLVVMLSDFWAIALPSDSSVILRRALPGKRTQRSVNDNNIEGWKFVQDASSKRPRSSGGDYMAITPEQVLAAENRVVDFERGSYVDIAQDERDQLTAVQNETILSYIRKNCTACLAREEAKISRINQVKRDLLEKLGLKSPPNVTGANLPLGPLQKILRAQMPGGYQNDMPVPDYQDLDYRAKTERIYTFGHPPLPEWNLAESQRDSIATFRFSEVTMTSEVAKAHLHFYIRRPQSTPREGVAFILLQLYRVTNVKDPNDIQTELVKTKEIKIDLGSAYGHWEHLSIRKVVSHWFHRPEDNFGLIVRADYQGENLAVAPLAGSLNDEAHNMYLDLETTFGVKSRQRRDTSMRIDCQSTQESRCCRHKLVVDFQKFGWDWVIAPKSYMAYYCSGQCPFRYLQQYVHTYVAQNAGVGPCCTPADMADILMIYFNNDREVVVSKVPGMVVTRCGCA